MPRIRPRPEVLALLQARERTLLDALREVERATEAIFGGKTLYRLRVLSLRAAWLKARADVAEARARTLPSDDPFESEPTEDAPDA